MNIKKVGRVMHLLATVAVIVVLFFVLATGYVAIGQSKYVYFPDNDVVATPTSVGLAFEDLSLKTEDGESIKAWYVPCEAAKNDAMTILFCHGNAGDMGDRVGTLQTFHKLGFNTLAFDYRGFGESSGEPTEDGTYLDAMACWDYLVDKRKDRPENIIVFGRSLGGAVACWLAVHADPAALVLESTFASIPAMAHEMFPFLPVSLFCRFKYDNVSNVADVHCPVMVAHGQKDRTCPYEHGRKIYEAANEPKQFVEIKGDHNDGGLNSNQHYQDDFMKFVAGVASGK